MSLIHQRAAHKIQQGAALLLTLHAKSWCKALHYPCSSFTSMCTSNIQHRPTEDESVQPYEPLPSSVEFYGGWHTQNSFTVFAVSTTVIPFTKLSILKKRPSSAAAWVTKTGCYTFLAFVTYVHPRQTLLNRKHLEWFCFTTCILRPCQNLAPTVPAMQLNHLQFVLILESVMLVADVASASDGWGAATESGKLTSV